MSRRHPVQPEPFGEILGHGPGNVPVYSSFYESLREDEMQDRSAFKSEIDGVFMGYKWQCVELARRWLYQNKGYIFDDIAMAYDIFRLRNVTVIKDGSTLPLHSFRNGSKRPPEVGALLIWDEGGEFEMTGHVAVIVGISDDFIQVIEQNVEHTQWADGTSWSRELPFRIDGERRWWIDCTYEDASILGWVIQTDNNEHAEIIEEPDASLFRIASRQVQPKEGDWLDVDREAQAAYVDFMGGCRLATRDEDLGRYFVISDTARKELKRATNELHAMFIRATDFVLNSSSLLERFCFPEALLPRIRQSWHNRRTHNITGRFDFAMTENGLKVYEYNADSAGCHMECGMVQGLWARHHGVSEGRDPGARLFDALVSSWRECGIDSVLHVLQDDDVEETYHALYMKSAIEAADVKCKLIRGVEGLGWDSSGCVVDADGERIDWVWKTWAWETALDQLRDEAVDEEAFLAGHDPKEPRTHAPRLVDILLRPEVMVFEPLWSLIPSNKAILPVLWDLYPNHPYLLESHFELTDALKEQGFVRKPIVGRCGKNIALVDSKNQVLEETGGQFDNRDNIYQALYSLPIIDGLSAQICTFTVDGVDAGACVRCDSSMVIKSHSDLLALRVLPDELFTREVLKS